MARIRAANEFLGFLFGLVLCYAVAAALLLVLGRLALVSDPPAWGALVLILLLYLAIGLFPLLWFGQMIDQARIAISGKLCLSREAGIIERNGTCIARLDDVVRIEMETSSTGNGDMHYLFIILRNGESLKIHESADTEEITGLGEALAERCFRYRSTPLLSPFADHRSPADASERRAARRPTKRRCS